MKLPAPPQRKVGIGAAAGAATTIGVWIASHNGVAIPGEIASAITFLLTFVASYFVSNGE